MAKIIEAIRVDADIDTVWASWDDFGNIARFNPALSASHLLGDAEKPTRVGTRRHCDLRDGRNWLREEVIQHVPGIRMKIDVYDSSMPVRSMRATIEFEAISARRTRVRFIAEFAPRYGLLGKLMEPLMKRQFSGIVKEMLAGNAAYVERGQINARAA